MNPETQFITDLAELRSVIRSAKHIDLCVHDSTGKFLFFAKVTKQEALRLAVESDRLDDYAAKWEPGTRTLTLGDCFQSGLRESRAPRRRAFARHQAELVRDYCVRAGEPVPQYIEAKLAS